MAEKKTVLTFAGLKKYEDELQELKLVKRKEVAEKIKEARGQGDLSENAEYDLAKEEQAEIAARIFALEKMLRNAEVVYEEDLDKNAINVGSTVVVLDVDLKLEMKLAIVGSAETDPVNGKISNESPLGMALIGRSAGDTIEVATPDGIIGYDIVSIE